MLSLTIQPEFAIECLDAQIDRGGSLWKKLGLTNLSQILMRSGSDIGLSCTKEVVSISFAT